MSPQPELRVVKDRVCSNCDHATIGPYGVHCTIFHEDIHVETVAENCEMWEP